MLKKTSIGIRCITESSKGFGNLGRCITVAKELRKKGHKPYFIINSTKSSISSIQKKFDYKIIPKSTNYEKDPKLIKEIMQSIKSRIVIIDMREFSEKISKKLMSSEIFTILLDDAWCKKAYADIVINGTGIKKYHRYSKINKKSKIFSGLNYWIANNEFRKHKKRYTEIKNKKQYKIIISMGGSDPNELSKFVFRSIIDMYNINIKVIIGPFTKKKSKFIKEIQNEQKASIVLSPIKIWKEFQKADVVLSNGGSTLHELAIQGIPTLAIAAFDHQNPYTKFFASKCFCINLGQWDKVTPKKIQTSLLTLLEKKNHRQRMSKAGQMLLDGYGTARVTDIIDVVVKKWRN